MARLELDLSNINRQRSNVADLQTRKRRLDYEIASAEAALLRAEQAGASPNVTVPLRVRVDELRAARAEVLAQWREQTRAVDRQSNALLAERDPASMVEALDGSLPIALLPMRLETRYTHEGTRLRIRVYPDDINIVEHTPALTDPERLTGTQYWEAVFRADQDEADRLARDLAVRVGRNRCAWVLRVLTPENPDEAGQDGAQPRFPEAELIDARSKQTRALLLPDRWCAIGYGPGRQEVFRVWGQRIPDELVLTPDWTDKAQAEALLDGERAWLADFDAALANGMALEVLQSQVDEFTRLHHVQPFRLASQTLERLIVVGLEWSKDPRQSSDELSDLLAAQRDSNGLGFLPLATPTNNIDSARAGYSTAVQRSAPPTPSENANLPKERDALDLITEALGLDRDRLTAQGVDNAHLSEQRTSLHMLNVLWRGTFGHYLMELWNAPGEEKDRILKTPDLYELRRYVVSHLRPGGPLPLLRVGKQPYGILPVVGKGFVPDPVGGLRFLRDPQAAVEANVGKVLGILRPLWEQASATVPLLKDGSVEMAKDILQTSPWSQAAYYRNVDNLCLNAPPIFNVEGVQQPTKAYLINQILATLGVAKDWYTLPVYSCLNFPPDGPYKPGSLAGVPWVLADARDPTREAAPETLLPDAQNYLKSVYDALTQNSASADALLSSYQTGPNLLQALVSYSVQMERHDAVQTFALGTSAVSAVYSVAQPRLVNIETPYQNEAVFQVNSPAQLAQVAIPALTGQLALGDYVSYRLANTAVAAPGEGSLRAGTRFIDAIANITPALRDVTGVRLSLDYLRSRSVGELNIALRTTLDAFSYRLDSWYTARATRRLERLRGRAARGLYVGGFAWVENLRADRRPDSDGYLLAPSQAQAAAAALLRSGFMANHEQGAFNIQLDSRRARRAQDLLQGLTRDQPLAALYGYRIERGLRDALLGKLIWPLRLAYPWHANDGNLSSDPYEAIGARDVVDGVALLDGWETDAAAVWTRLRTVNVNGGRPFDTLNATERQLFEGIVRDVMDIADSVSDLLLAEGTYQIAQGNFDRAGAAMAVIDKQTLPIETQVTKTPRGGASYTQRLALLCPRVADERWPQDRKARAEPALDAWLAYMLGDPARYVFSATVHRGKTPEGNAIIDAEPLVITLADLGFSALSAVLAATIATRNDLHGPVETGLRARIAAAFTASVADAQTVTGLDIGTDDSGAPGLAHFEAIASTLKTLIDQSRPLTRKDLVVPEDGIEDGLPGQGEYPGVDLTDVRARADVLIADFTALKDAVSASVDADELLAALAALEDFLPAARWPQEAVAIDAAGADPATREARADLARIAVMAMLQASLDAVNAPIATAEGEAPTNAQLIQQALTQIRQLLGKDFPVLPRFTLNAYAGSINTSLADQAALTRTNPWRVAEWLPQMARVREGVDRFGAALAAHETLVDAAAAADFKVVQIPHRAGQTWAALPEAWREEDGVPPDTSKLPEELRDYVAQQGIAWKDIQRIAPKLALALHTPGGLDAVQEDDTLAGMMCDEWAEFIPDPFQTAAIAFHYDAPGARPPQSILLAVPPRPDQENWRFDDLLDVLHEAWDLARLRAVRPKDLGAGLGLLLPGNYLPHDYTGDLPGVRALELARQALRKKFSAGKIATIPLGKV